MTDERLLTMLFSRMTWPSLLARERACTAIASLLASSESSTTTCEHYLRWVSGLEHESVVGLAILSLLRAEMIAPGCCSSLASEIDWNLLKPSLVSWLLIKEFGKCELKFNIGAWHSGDPPTEFKTDIRFDKYKRNFLPPTYADSADALERDCHVSFNRQWAFEWEVVAKREHTEVSFEGFEYWLGHRESEGRRMGVDVPMSEVYRSSYLRALAWAGDTGRCPACVVECFAARTVPIDLELWRLRPMSRPDWWPIVKGCNGVVESGADEIWPAIEELWLDQKNGKSPCGGEWVLAHANGQIRGGKTVYDLSLFAFFQRVCDAGDPKESDIFQICASEQTEWEDPIIAKLKYAGKVAVQKRADHEVVVDGWRVYPMVARLPPPGVVCRWQWWRMHRGLWGPSATLTRDGFAVSRDGDKLLFNSDIQAVGMWNDWTHCLREEVDLSTPPPTGNILLLNRSIVEENAASHGLNICWIVRLTTFCRKEKWEPFVPFEECRVFGASRIVLPT